MAARAKASRLPSRTSGAVLARTSPPPLPSVVEDASRRISSPTRRRNARCQALPSWWRTTQASAAWCIATIIARRGAGLAERVADVGNHAHRRAGPAELARDEEGPSNHCASPRRSPPWGRRHRDRPRPRVLPRCRPRPGRGWRCRRRPTRPGRTFRCPELRARCRAFPAGPCSYRLPNSIRLENRSHLNRISSIDLSKTRHHAL